MKKIIGILVVLSVLIVQFSFGIKKKIQFPCNRDLFYLKFTYENKTV